MSNRCETCCCLGRYFKIPVILSDRARAGEPHKPPMRDLLLAVTSFRTCFLTDNRDKITVGGLVPVPQEAVGNTIPLTRLFLALDQV